jgi:hypothetical protein
MLALNDVFEGDGGWKQPAQSAAVATEWNGSRTDQHNA